MNIKTSLIIQGIIYLIVGLLGIHMINISRSDSQHACKCDSKSWLKLIGFFVAIGNFVALGILIYLYFKLGHMAN